MLDMVGHDVQILLRTCQNIEVIASLGLNATSNNKSYTTKKSSTLLPTTDYYY